MRERKEVAVEAVWDPALGATPDNWFNWKHKLVKDSIWEVFWVTRLSLKKDLEGTER